jgi:hypothetical protein
MNLSLHTERNTETKEDIVAPEIQGSFNTNTKHAVTYLVEALSYKPESRGFESRLGGFFQLA